MQETIQVIAELCGGLSFMGAFLTLMYFGLFGILSEETVSGHVLIPKHFWKNIGALLLITLSLGLIAVVLQ